MRPPQDPWPRCLLFITLLTITASIGVFSGHPLVEAATPLFSPTGTRDPVLWPFDKLSPWNRPLGANAGYQPIQKALTGGGFTSGSLNYSKWTVPFWVASSNDPIRKIYPKRWNGELRPSGFFVEYRIPDAATPSPDSDGNMIVITPGHLTEVELYRATKRPDGGWDAQNGREVDLKSDGRFGTVTNGTALGGGVIRAGELRNGIKHALAFTAYKKMWNRYAPGGKPSVWPARMADHYALDPEPGGYGSSGNLYMGSWVAIPPTVNITALGLETPEGHVLARALQDYGAIGTISGGSGSRIVFRYDYAAHLSGIAPAADMEAFKRDLNRLARQLHVVVNSHNNGKAPTLGPTEGIGGGTPRTSFAPDFPRSKP